MKWRKSASWSAAATAALCGSLLIYSTLVEPNRVTVHHVTITDGTLGHLLADKVVVQMSDLHMQSLGRRERKVLELVNALDPDIVFLTGDYVSWDGDYEPALTLLSRLHAKIGIWAVMGDYDYSRSRKSCLFCHEEGSTAKTRRHPVQFLRNEVASVPIGGGILAVEGVDGEAWDDYPLAKKRSLLQGCGALIILSHNPLMFKEIDDDKHVLVLAGDTHGGQVPVPSWLYRVLGYEKTARFPRGLYRQKDKIMFVSQGIGTSHVPVRFLRTPEIVVFHFERE